LQRTNLHALSESMDSEKPMIERLETGIQCRHGLIARLSESGATGRLADLLGDMPNGRKVIDVLSRELRRLEGVDPPLRWEEAHR